MINSPLKTHYTRFIFKLGPTVPLNVLWVFSLDLKYVSILDRKKTFLEKVFFCLGKYMGLYIRRFIFLIYIFLKQESISLSLVSETGLFLKQGFLFSFLLLIYLVVSFFTSSSSAQSHHHLKAKKRIGYFGTQSPNFSS